MIWIIKGPARLRRAEISGVARNRPKLTFDVHTGYGVACVRTYTVEPPSGLTFPRRRLGRHVVAARRRPRTITGDCGSASALRDGALRIGTRGPSVLLGPVHDLRSACHAELRREPCGHHGRRAPLRRVMVLAANGHGKPRTLVRYAAVG